MRHTLTPPPGVMPIVTHTQLPAHIMAAVERRREMRRMLKAQADAGCREAYRDLMDMAR